MREDAPAFTLRLDDGEVGGAVVREDTPAFTLWLDDVEIASGRRVAFARVSDGVTALSVDGGAMVPERRASCPPVETPREMCEAEELGRESVADRSEVDDTYDNVRP